MKNSGAQKGTKRIPLGIVGGTKFSRYPTMTDETTINMMVTGDKNSQALVNYLGYKKEISFPKGEPRGIYVSTRLNEMFVVIGGNLYIINNVLGYRLLGNLDTFSGPVFMIENQNNQIGLVDGLNLYVYNYLFNTFNRIIVPNITPSYIEFLDTYAILSDSNRGLYIISAPNDMTSYTALDEATIQTKADQLQATPRLDRTLFVQGKKATELWNDQPTQAVQGLGSINFPFKRNNSFSIDYGVISTSTIASAFGMLVWFGFNTESGPSIVYTNGGKPQLVSGEGLDFLLNNLKKPEDSTAFLFKDNGHILYQITFFNPLDDKTIVYDFTNQLWYNATDENLSHFIAKKTAYFNDKFYFINFDKNDPGLYEMNVNINTYDGKTIPRVRVTEPIKLDGQGFILNRVELMMEHGESDDYRRIDLAASFDGGQSFQYGAQPFIMNQLGHRIGQVKWFKLGFGNDIRLKFQFWSKGRFVVTSGNGDIVS